MALFEQRIEFSPGGGDLDSWLREVPARWAVALLADEAGRPLHLLSLKDLRQGLRNRLQEQQTSGRGVNWREVVRQISWQAVDSELEADCVYLAAAKEVFPEIYRELIARNRAWFIHVDPAAEFPRYTKTTDLSVSAGRLIGPIADKHAAARLIELIEDAFDLCRYHHILTQYPHGKACAYKEMGKCPAPCDGSITIEQYRRMVELSVAGILETPNLIDEHTGRMEQAAQELRFETAAKIRAYIDQLAQLRQGSFKQARPMEEFAYVAIQPGPRAKQAKVFLILPRRIEAVACLIGEQKQTQELISTILKLADDVLAARDSDGDAIGLAARHLFAPKTSAGTFIALADLNETSMQAAYGHVCRKRVRPSRVLPTLADKAGISPGQTS